MCQISVLLFLLSSHVTKVDGYVVLIVVWLCNVGSLDEENVMLDL